MPAQSHRLLPSSVVTVSPRLARQAATRRQVLTPSLFGDALLREQRRAERFDQVFGLVVISLTRNLQTELQMGPLLDALAAVRCDADVIGWLKEGAAIGLIRSNVDLDPLENAASLEATIRRDIEAGLPADASPECGIRAFVCPKDTESLGPALASLLEPGKRPARFTSGALDRAAKRTLDVAGSAALLAMCSPVFLIVAALVKATSKGPVFFRQERVGQQARPFTMLKFRTMRVDCGHELHQNYVSQFIQGKAPAAEAGPATTAVFKIVGDPRVTKIGSFLRR
jgi:hypothetical protein